LTGTFLKENNKNKYMKTLLKIFVTIFLAACILSLFLGAYRLFIGNYFYNASLINSVLIVLIGAAAIIFFVWLIRKTWVLGLLVIATVQACSYAKSNQQVVVSEDCGMTWKKINVGEAVPKEGMNRCYMKVVMPNYPMQGESKFISNFKDKVRASIHVDYDYSIIEPLAFIKQAKYLGSANTDADSEAALNSSVFETAENSVIDKRLREVIKAKLIGEDIVDADQAELENYIQDAANKMLEPLGVHLNFITLTFDLDMQTRQAIDVATAMKIYESKGLSDVGKTVTAARAGAPIITVENKTETKPAN
jgi:hypothetical protein